MIFLMIANQGILPAAVKNSIPFLPHSSHNLPAT
jgi:hypothetical protein